MLLSPLYHWSPRDRRKSIWRLGLMPGKKPTCMTGESGDEELDKAMREWRAPYVCLGTSPSIAWGLSGDIFGEPLQLWDLWQVQLEANDEVHVNPIFGRHVTEVRVHNRIYKSRVWWVAERTR